MKNSIKKRILLLAVVPVLMLGLLIIGITLTMVKGSLIDKVEESLKGTASATLAAYDQNSGSYLQAENGDIWKGAYNISKSEALVDSIKENSGMDVTFFYGDRRVVTSVVDADGARVLGSPAGNVIVEKVLQNGEEYFSGNVSLDGTMHYGYFIPVYQKGDSAKPIGMIFAGVNKAKQDAAMNRIIIFVIVAVLAIMFLCIMLAFVISESLVKSLKKSIGQLQTVAGGDLSVKVDEGLLKRRDEVGDLSRALQMLQNALQNIIRRISDNVKEIRTSAEDLGASSQKTTEAMYQVSSSVTQIADSAVEQARQSQGASATVNEMGDRISRTAEEAEALNRNAASMSDSSEQASNTMQQLIRINDEVTQSVDLVTTQTNKTNASAQKIKKAADIIVEIAEETNLLALNASIEAARAGDSGRGFAVVASQIQKLAEQSNESSTEIVQVIEELIRDSNDTVAAMEHVQDIIRDQNENMMRTGRIVGEVTGGIRESIQSINQIGRAAEELAASRSEIVNTVGSLAQAAQANEQITQETNESASNVTASIEQVEKSAERLQEIAEELAGSMEYFRM